MENKEDILDALEEFERTSTNQNENVPPILDDYLLSIARTGETLFPWCKMKTLFMKKLNAVVTDFEQNVPMDTSEVLPNVENICFNEMTERLRSAIAKFNGIPFTIQRLCELITDPHKHYKKTDKFLRGIEKNVMVVSTVDPHGTKIVNEQKAMVNGIDSANGFSKTPEKFSMTMISPTPVNSPVTTGERWYTSLAGAGDSTASHNTWQQQELPLATSVVPCTVEGVSDENGTTETVETANVENGKDVDNDDSLVKDGDLNEAEVVPSTEAVASTETAVASTETAVASTEPTVASMEATVDFPEGTVASTEDSVASSDNVSDSDARTNTAEPCGDDSHLDVTPDYDYSLTVTPLDSVDAAQPDVTNCTSPDSSDAVEAPSSGVSSDTNEVDADTSECTTAKRQRRDSGGFDTPVLEERVESETNPDTAEDSSSPTHTAIDAAAPPDSSNVVDTASMPEKSPEHDVCTESVVIDSVTHDNSTEVEHSNSSTSSQSSEEGSEVVDASPSQSDGSSDVTDSNCAQLEGSSVESSSVGGDSCDDVSSSRHEPMDTD